MGNTLCNFFSGMDDIRIANVYCHTDKPTTDMNGSVRFFRITDKELVKSIVKKDYSAGDEICVTEKKDVYTGSIPGYDVFRSMRLQIFFEIREWIWKLGKWKTEGLRVFLNENNPDIIFQPIYNSRYIYDVVDFCEDYLKIPIVSYAVDDYYSLRQFSLSPFFWTDRMVKRKRIRHLIEKSSILYVISDTQKEEYAPLFSTPCKVLTKGYEFGALPAYDNPEKCIRMVYGGMINRGRYKSLKAISKSVEHLRERGYGISLEIYSKDIKNRRMRNGLSNKGTKLHEGIPYSDLYEIEKTASVLVHVEGLGIKDRFTVHQSFSTKLVDYFYLGKCIFAIGKKDMASIKHLAENDAAIIATSNKEIYNKIYGIVENPGCIKEYGEAAYECGKKWHDKAQMQDMLYKDLLSVV